MSPFRPTHPPTTTASLLLPLALTLTSAAVAAAGLFLWPGGGGGFPSDTDSDTDGGGGGGGGGAGSGSLRRKSSRAKRMRKYDRITEEDTDGLEEERRKGGGKGKGREKEGAGGGGGMMMAGALVGENIGSGHGVSGASGRMEEKKVEVVGGSGSVGGGGVVVGGKQYVPPPPRKKSVAIVVSERKALPGQESGMGPEEAGLPSSLLSHLPHPLDLTHTIVNILIYSPQLKAHPLSRQSAFRAQAAAREPIGATSSTTSRPPRKPSAPHFSPSASTFTLAASMLPSSCPLEHILPFTQATSIVPLLRALEPDTVYIEEPLTLPSDGGIVATLLQGRWVGNIVVGLIGDDDQLAQLMDSDDEKAQEDEKTRKGEGKWWGTETPGSIRGAFGSRVQIVEGWVLVEDWRRRVVERS